MKAFFKLIQIQKLFFVFFIFFIFRYGFLSFQNINLALSPLYYFLLAIAGMCIAAGGFIIEAIENQTADTINYGKSRLGDTFSENRANMGYIIFTSIGVITGFLVSHHIGKNNFSGVFIFSAAVLYLNATSFKHIVFLKNIIASLLLAVCILIIGVFDMYPMIDGKNNIVLSGLFRILIDFSVFTFILHIIYSLIRNIAETKGDYNQGNQTLPIVLGVSRTKYVTLALIGIGLFLLGYYALNYLYAFELYFALVYSILIIGSLMVFLMIKLFKAKNIDHFHKLMRITGWILVFSILHILIISLNIKHNAV